MKPFHWIYQYAKPYKWKYVVSLFFSSITILMGLANPYIMGRIADEVFEKKNFDALLPLLLLLSSLTLIKTFIRYFCLMSYERMSQGIIYQLRLDTYQRIQSQSFPFFDSNKVGDIMSRMTGDIDAIRHFFAAVVYSLFENILTFFVAMGLVFMLSWEIGACMLVIAPIVLVVTLRQAKEIKGKFSAIREQFSRLNSVCQENISGNRVVKAFTQEEYEIEKFTVENEAFNEKNIQATDTWVKYLPIQDFFAGFMSVLLIAIGGVLAIMGKIHLWELIAINGYLWAINNPMRMVGWLMNDIQRFVASIDKIYGLIRTKIAVVNCANPYVAETLQGSVEFKNVNFYYDKNNGAPILKNISFHVPKGFTVGIVGSTGAGKSTIVNLISRFYDATEGEILIDGRDIRTYEMKSLRSHISHAMQDVFLFSDTVEGNLAYGVPDAPIEDLYNAAGIADADGFIRNMPEGYDTIVGERGVGLSGGQKQRLSLARAIATNPSILILDDTTSAVDMETEHFIQQELQKNYADRTTFVIAHRISSVKPADLILVLVNGEIIERGNHDELMEQKGYYYRLFLDQYDLEGVNA